MKKKDKGRATRFKGVKALGNGKYRLRIYVTDPDTGRQVERTKTVTAGSAADAYRMKELEELQVRQQQEETERPSEAPVSGSMPLGQVAEAWLKEVITRRHEEDPAQLHLTPATRDRYQQTVQDLVLKAPVAAKLVGRVTAEDIKQWRDDLLAAGYRRSTINSAHRVLKTILRSAGNNTASAIKTLNERPDARITHREPNLLTAAELDSFLAATKERWPQHYALVLTLFTTTMRISTALALRWEDLDLETHEIVVVRRLSGSGKKAEVVAGVKRSRFGADYPPLLPEVYEALLKLKAAYNEAQRTSGLLFPSATGGHHARSVLDRPFKDILRHIGLTKRFTPHGCRRTGAKLYGRTAGTRMAMEIAGHLTERMHDHHAPVDAAEKQATACAVFGRLKVIEGGKEARSEVETGTPGDPGEVGSG